MSVAHALATTPVPARPKTEQTRQPTYITPAKLATEINRVFELEVSEKTLARWRSAGKGPPFVKLGRSVRYDVRDVARWIHAQRRNALAPQE